MIDIWKKILQELDDISPYLKASTDAALGTTGGDRAELIAGIENLYQICNLETPKIIFCDSPWQLANIVDFAGTADSFGFAKIEDAKAKFRQSQPTAFELVLGADRLTRCIDALAAKVESLRETEELILLTNSCKNSIKLSADLTDHRKRHSPDIFANTRLMSRKEREDHEFAQSVRLNLYNRVHDESPANRWAILKMMTSVMEGILNEEALSIYNATTSNCPWGHCHVAEVFTIDKGMLYEGDYGPYITSLHKIMLNSNMSFLGAEFALVANRPTKLTFNEEGRLHSADSPALEYADSFCLFALDGTIMKHKAVTAPISLTIADIEQEYNVEARRTLIDLYGMDRYIKECGAAYHGGLYRKAFDDDEALVVYELKKDGNTEYVRVNPDTRNAKQALDWCEVVGAYRPLYRDDANLLKLEPSRRITQEEDDITTKKLQHEVKDYTKELTRAVEIYKKAGLFNEQDTAKVIKAYQDELYENLESNGFPPPDLQGQIIGVLHHSDKYFWWGDPECDVCSVNVAYIDFVSELARAADETFAPSYCDEKWKGEFGPITVEIELNGKKHSFKPSYFDDWLDMSIIIWINGLIEGERKFETLSGGNYSNCLFITKAQKKMLIKELAYPFDTPD